VTGLVGLDDPPRSEVLELLLILVIDYTGWGNQLFGTAPIGPDVWLFVIPFAVGMLILEEFRKYLARRFINWPRH
jgi:sodium/potassium-transporting ATPase subunit alpha